MEKQNGCIFYWRWWVIRYIYIYNDIWNNVSNSISKRFLKNKIKPYGHEATDFHDDELPNSNYTCLTVISIDFFIKKDEKYYPKVSFRKYKYNNKEEKKWLHILPAIWEILLILMSLIKNKLGWSKFSLEQKV